MTIEQTSLADIVIGIPAHNEEVAIGELVRACLTLGSKHVVVVDDGSTDNTAIRAHRAGAMVLRHKQNHGKGAAIATLFEYARNCDAKALVLIDGDGQHNPLEIPAVVAPCLIGQADAVVGSRYLSIKSAIPWHRSLGLRAFNAMTAMVSGVPCSDSQSGFRAFNSRAIQIIEIAESTFSVECEQQFEFRHHGLVLAEVPISCNYDVPEKRSAYRQGIIVLSRLSLLALRRRLLGYHPPNLISPLRADTAIEVNRVDGDPIARASA